MNRNPNKKPSSSGKVSKPSSCSTNRTTKAAVVNRPSKDNMPGTSIKDAVVVNDTNVTVSTYIPRQSIME